MVYHVYTQKPVEILIFISDLYLIYISNYDRAIYNQITCVEATIGSDS